jgi:hypothetical protein
MTENPYLIELMMRERQRTRLQEAERLRLASSARMRRSDGRRRTPFLARLGDGLVLLGSRLQSRYARPIATR